MHVIIVMIVARFPGEFTRSLLNQYGMGRFNEALGYFRLGDSMGERKQAETCILRVYADFRNRFE